MHSIALTGRFCHIHTHRWLTKERSEQRRRSCRYPSSWYVLMMLVTALSLTSVQLLPQVFSLRSGGCEGQYVWIMSLLIKTIQWVLVSHDLHLKRNLIIQNNCVSSCRLFILKRPLVLCSAHVFQLFPLILRQSLLHTQNVSTLWFCALLSSRTRSCSKF